MNAWSIVWCSLAVIAPQTVSSQTASRSTTKPDSRAVRAAKASTLAANALTVSDRDFRERKPIWDQVRRLTSDASLDEGPTDAWRLRGLAAIFFHNKDEMVACLAALEHRRASLPLEKPAEAMRVALRAQLRAVGVSVKPESAPAESRPQWYVVLEAKVDPAVVTWEWGRKAIADTGLPWRVADRATGMELLLIPPDEYVRGAPADDTEASEDERPTNAVTITRPFYLGRYEVTSADYRVFDPTWPCLAFHLKQRYDPRRPVVNVSVSEVEAFCRGLSLRLPSQAEWEWACRAGCAAPRYGKLADIAWAGPGGSDGPYPVGLKKPNGFGLYDMLGNAREFTTDRPSQVGYGRYIGYGLGSDPSFEWLSECTRISCGGAWCDTSGCRASARYVTIHVGGLASGFRAVHDA